MTRTKAIIIDDEEGARESLANILSKFFPQIDVVAKANSAKTGLEVIRIHQPDLVFLDVEMPKGNAFDLLAELQKTDEKSIGFDVIFITAFDHYAIRAIKFSALDYLLKPIDIDDLRKAITRHEKKRHEKNSIHENLNVLLSNLKKENHVRKVAIPDMEGLTFIALNDIVRCESDGNYTLIFTSEGKKMLSSKSLAEYDEMLSAENFFRIHRSHLINLTHIKKYFRGDGGYVLMSDNSQLEISRRKKNEFMEKVGK